jgi:hypothetical protein
MLLPLADANPSHRDSVELTGHAGSLCVPQALSSSLAASSPGLPESLASLLSLSLDTACTDGPGVRASIPAFCTTLLLTGSWIQALDGASCPGRMFALYLLLPSV